MAQTTETALPSYDIASLSSKNGSVGAFPCTQMQMQAIYALWPWKETRDLNQDAPAPEVCPGHQDVCYSGVPSALHLTARHHHLAEPKALLQEGCTVVNVSTRSWDFSEFVLSDQKKNVLLRDSQIYYLIPT